MRKTRSGVPLAVENNHIQTIVSRFFLKFDFLLAPLLGYLGGTYGSQKRAKTDPKVKKSEKDVQEQKLKKRCGPQGPKTSKMITVTHFNYFFTGPRLAK